ncbi:MAG: hypothetical protein PHX70_06480 [Clostridium sp.]|nr:hypothetical protein [Clostridium sp.]
MKKFKFNYQPYIISLFSILIIVCLYIFSNNKKADLVIYIIALLFELFIIINGMCFYIGVSEKGIVSKNLRMNKFISWDKISKVVFNSNHSILTKVSISVIGSDEEITISTWHLHYKELIKIIVDECKKRDKRVDILVEKIIED